MNRLDKEINARKIPTKYAPSRNLTKKDREKALRAIRKSRRLYTRGIYYPRPHLSSFHSKPSKHVDNAMRKYSVKHVVPSKELSKKTRCSLKSLKKIVKKGEGAYYSSGSRPNQTAQSWGYARLASAITGGPASKIDYDILEKGCSEKSPALKIAIRP
jgi:hypothetical protein